MNFEYFNFHPSIMAGVHELGYTEPTPIQLESIPPILQGRDIIGQAQTGTGKTAAFGIPILEKLNVKDRAAQAIVLCPTRELAIQVAEEMNRLAKYKRYISILPIYGGQHIERQFHALKRGASIIAEVIGYGMSGDAYHITAPAPTASGASQCMQSALNDAQISPEQVDYINAHGTSTKQNDEYETLAVKKIFGEHAYKLAISTRKYLSTEN